MLVSLAPAGASRCSGKRSDAGGEVVSLGGQGDVPAEQNFLLAQQ